MERFRQLVLERQEALLERLRHHVARTPRVVEAAIPDITLITLVQRMTEIVARVSTSMGAATGGSPSRQDPLLRSIDPFAYVSLLDCLRSSFLDLFNSEKLSGEEHARAVERVDLVFRRQLTLALLEGGSQSWSSQLEGAQPQAAGAGRTVGGYKTLFENSPIPILFAMADGRILDCNQAACDMYGYVKNELVGMQVDRLAPDSVRDSIPEFIVEQLPPGGHGQIETLNLGKQGRPFPVQWTTRVVQFDSEPVVIMWVHDVTDRNAAQERLGEVEEQYLRLFERLPLGLYRTTPEGDILDANPAMLQMLGCPDLAALKEAHALGVYLDPQDRAREVEILLRDGMVRAFETRWRRRDGKEVWVKDTATVVRDANGRVAYFEGAAEDITDRKRLEEQFLQAQKMEAIGQLAGGIAHDFNNLLVVVCGCSELILESMSHNDPVRADVVEIKRAGERASALTRQLLALSRRQVLEMRLLNLNEVLDGFGKMLRRILGEDVSLELRLAGVLDDVLADAGQIEQVLVNLAVNARDSMPRGGVLIIETRNVMVDLRPGMAPTRAVMLAVSDSGCGMAPDVLDHMFEPFFTTKPPGKGTGLGLATVYGIVKQSNGEIRVESRLGGGTTVRIYLPPADKRALQPEVSRSNPPPAVGKETILLVEDQEDVRQVTGRMLQHLGYKVLAASSGEQALQIVKTAGPIQLVLTDVVMPEMSGTQMVERLRATGREFRVLYMSGHADDTMIRHGVTDADGAFLPKPVTLSKLAAKVREVLAD